MKALDTTVLLKYATVRRNRQQDLLEPLFLKYADTAHFYVSDIVIVEVTNYLEENIKYDKSHIEGVVNALAVSPKIELQNKKSVQEALKLYKHQNQPFADCLKNVFNSERNCTETLREIDRKIVSKAYSKLAG